MAEKRKPAITQEKAEDQPGTLTEHLAESQVAELLTILEEETQLTIRQAEEGWTVEDAPRERVVVRNEPLESAVRAALRYLKMMTGGGGR